MNAADHIPALLRPLSGQVSLVEGHGGAESALHALRDALARTDSVKTLRVRPGRAVFEVKTTSGEFIVKAYEPGFMGKMSPARFCESGAEWRALELAARRSIPTATGLALLSAKARPAVNYVVTQRIAGAAELEAYLERESDRLRDDARLQRKVVEGFAGLVAGLHKAGLLHRDLHLRNILISPPRRGEDAQFYVVDLDEADFTGPMPPLADRVANLAMLSLCFPMVSQATRRRFYVAYCRALGESELRRETIREIEERAIAREFELNTVRVATCTEPSSAIARVARGDTLLLIFRRASNADLEQLESPLAKAAPETWPQLLQDHFELRLGEGHLWKLKTPIEAVNGPPARRKLEAMWGRLLELNAIRAGAPAPLACLVQVPELAVYARLPGTLSPLMKLKDHGSLPFFEELGRMLVRLHRHGCYYLPLEPEVLAEGLNVCVDRRGRRTLVLTAPDHIFRGTPTALGQQAVASLGRVARAVSAQAGERAMKEMIWSYSRVLRLNHFDTGALLDEAKRIPTGNTLVMTRGIERSRIAR